MKLKRMIKTALLSCGMLCMAVSCSAASGPVEIPFSAIEGVQVGNAQNDVGKTGVTVLLFKDSAKTGVHISGGGPASRETPVLDPTKEDLGIHAVVLGGGSAYGLAAADGDTIQASSCGKQVPADVNMVGTLAAEVMSKAIENAITASKMKDEEYLKYCL